jgi:hypothetical protein
MTRAIFLLSCAAALLAAPGTVSAQEKRPEVVRLRVGIAEHYKVGQWTPVEITLRGGSEQMTGQVSLTVPDGDGVPSRVVTPPNKPCQVLPGQETSVLLYARFGEINSEATVALRVGDRVVAAKSFTSSMEADAEHYPSAMLAEQRLVVEVGPGSVGIEEAVERADRDSTSMGGSAVARVTDVGQLPTRWYGYEGVDAVVISTSRPEMFHKLLAGSSARLEALDQWVRMGGRLVLLVGSQGSEVLHPEAPLARLAPGKLEKMVPLGETGALESYAENASTVPTSGDGRLSMMAPRLTDIEGTVEAWQADLPMIVRATRGFGQVVFVAADLDRAPLNQWKDRKLLVARLLGLPAKLDEEISESSVMMRPGFEDISGQLRSALDEFTGVRLVPFWAVVAGILVYILLIGPADYFFLRRLRHMEWTWFTFPLVVIVFSAGAYWLAYRLKGDQLRTNQIDLVDVDTAGGMVRGTTWANVFSPRAESYNLGLRPILPDGKTAEDARVLFSWLGLPGEGFGGMNSRTAGSSMWRRSYAFSPELDAMEDVPIQVWSTKSVTSRWSASWKDCLKADLVRQEDVPKGRITNSLDFPLEDCLLVYDRWAYQLGTLRPGDSREIDSFVERAELKTLLTGRRIVLGENDDKLRQQPTLYDAASRDIPYIVRAMMFYNAAGGLRYTRLSNQYQPFVDFSGLLGPNCAILVARSPGAANPGAELLRDGEPLGGEQSRHVTMFRFVLPVRKQGAGAGG